MAVDNCFTTKSLRNIFGAPRIEPATPWISLCIYIDTLNGHIWLLLNGWTSVGNASKDENKKNIDRKENTYYVYMYKNVINTYIEKNAYKINIS